MKDLIDMVTRNISSANRVTLDRSLLFNFFADFGRTGIVRREFLKAALEFDILQCFPGTGLSSFFMDQNTPVEIERTKVVRCSASGDVLVTGLLRQGSYIKVLNLKLAQREASVKILVTARACHQINQMRAPTKWIAPKKFLAVLS